MRAFLDENFLLQNKTAEVLYHDYAAQMPVIDYHCHLSPSDIAHDRRYENLTQAWLQGDHYKWRAMRSNGIDESYITGSRPDREKFLKWAATVPFTLRNPLYHWTHLELRRYFDITDILNEKTAGKIYDDCSAQLHSADNSVRGLIKKMNVEVIGTTDDPLDDLENHRQLKKSWPDVKVYPSFRPDAAMNVDDTVSLNAWINRLEVIVGKPIDNFNDYLDALKGRHDFFGLNGCTVSDHGLEEIYVEDYEHAELVKIFEKIRCDKDITHLENKKFKSAMLLGFAEWDAEKNWVQQFHLGAMRNNNSRMYTRSGPDTGWDSIGDFSHGKSLVKFLNKLDSRGLLAKTIIYNLNPAENEVMASLTGNFNSDGKGARIQWGAAWWFLDQKDGMIKQLNALSAMGLLSKFVGMLTDSRSFLSYPRHEYFRRILCNIFGQEIEGGELPADIKWTGKIIQDICCNNARSYFGW